jgi:nanoRNase/pAp phosphatase (c-di-AMP/oligoRNAs hydrolase)
MIESEYYFDISRRIANLKALQRMSFQKIGDIVIAWTHVGAFEGSAAKMLLLAGADVAFVASDKKEGSRVSARAKPEIVMNGLHLGQIMSDLGSEVEGSGGGHAGAAGIVVRNDVGEVLRLCVERTARIVESMIERRDEGET